MQKSKDNEVSYQRVKIKTAQITLCVREGSATLTRCATPRDVAAVAREFIYSRLDHDREHFVIMCFDGRNQVTAIKLISSGILTASLVHPREVFRYAIYHGAAGIVVAHNHPSGDPEPSPEDLEVTRRLVAVGDLVGIRVLDHVIVTQTWSKYVSLLERGLI